MNGADEKSAPPIGIQRVRSSGSFVQHVDPVCGMVVEAEGEIGFVDLEGTRYLFCAKRCRDRFRQNPQLFLDPEKRNSRKPKNAVYICPMDPEIVEMEPIPCRICGMALEPAIPSESDGPDPEYVEMMRKFRLSAFLTAPLLFIAMGEMTGVFNKSLETYSPFPNFIYWIQFFLATPTVFWGGLPLLQRGVASVKQRAPNMFTLIALGVCVAHLFSTAVLLFPDNPIWKTFKDGNHGLPIFYEASAVIITLALLGQVLESRARRRTGDSIRELVALRPENATVVLSDEDEVVVPVSDLEVGAVIRIAANERIPVDGIVLEGTSQIDESMVTGESSPVTKTIDDELFGGTINGNRNLLMRATRVGDDTMISRIVTMVSEAQRSKAPVQKLADVVSGYFVPIVMIISLISLVAWSLQGNIIFGVVTSVSVLIIACPCALGLATPMSIMVGSGVAAQNGILLKGGEAIQNLSQIDTLALDKTGTLTSGRPSVVDVIALSDLSESEIIGIAGSVEVHSEHPLALAVVRAATERGSDLMPCEDFVSMTSVGVSGRVGGLVAFVGRPAKSEKFSNETRSVIEVRLDDIPIGLIYIEDSIAESAIELKQALDSLGIEPVILTGDSQGVAKSVAEKLKIEKFHDSLLPEGKTEIIEEMKRNGRKVAMVGDGVNDAPALAIADVGVAIGTGTAAAIETSEVTLLSGNVSDVIRAIKLSRNLMTNIRQNLFFAFAYNIIGIPIAAGVLYPSLGLLLSPMVASLAMTFSSVSVIANALRLRKTIL